MPQGPQYIYIQPPLLLAVRNLGFKRGTNLLSLYIYRYIYAVPLCAGEGQQTSVIKSPISAQPHHVSSLGHSWDLDAGDVLWVRTWHYDYKVRSAEKSQSVTVRVNVPTIRCCSPARSSSLTART
jgi:hypothetical protein